MTDEFISCYLMTDEAIEAYLEHIQFQTGLTIEEILGNEEA